MRPRDALERWGTGLRRTAACHHDGIVSRRTKMFPADVSGIRNTKLVVITDCGFFTFMLKMIQIQESASAKISTRANARKTPTAPPAGRKPRMRPRLAISDAATE